MSTTPEPETLPATKRRKGRPTMAPEARRKPLGVTLPASYVALIDKLSSMSGVKRSDIAERVFKRALRHVYNEVIEETRKRRQDEKELLAPQPPSLAQENAQEKEKEKEHADGA